MTPASPYAVAVFVFCAVLLVATLVVVAAGHLPY
jgi:hypothetical protein